MKSACVLNGTWEYCDSGKRLRVIFSLELNRSQHEICSIVAALKNLSNSSVERKAKLRTDAKINPNYTGLSEHALECRIKYARIMIEITSDNYYNQIGATYRSISQLRMNYLKAVDDIVISTATEHDIGSWLDIGVGNGERLLALRTKVHCKRVYCLEPSEHMFKEALQNLGDKCKVMAESLSSYCQDSGERFSFVTALWNVIGHCDDPVRFLRDAYTLLDKDGILLLDANNRYNIRQYGAKRVMRNVFLDFFGRGRKGKFRLKTESGYEFTNVYIASPFDIRQACKTLKIENLSIDYVNYSTGRPANFLTGQMVVRISKG